MIIIALDEKMSILTIKIHAFFGPHEAEEMQGPAAMVPNEFFEWYNQKIIYIHPGRLTAGTYSHHPFGKENDLNQTCRIMFHVNLQGCTGWWFQCIWKIFVKMGIFPNFRGENKTYQISGFFQECYLLLFCRNFEKFYHVCFPKKHPTTQPQPSQQTPFLPSFWLLPPSQPTLPRHVWCIENPRSITNSPQRVSGLGRVAKKAAQSFPQKQSVKTWGISPQWFVILWPHRGGRFTLPETGGWNTIAFLFGARPIFGGY